VPISDYGKFISILLYLFHSHWRLDLVYYSWFTYVSKLSDCKHLSMKIYLDEGMRDCKGRRGCRVTPREKGNREQWQQGHIISWHSIRGVTWKERQQAQDCGSEGRRGTRDRAGIDLVSKPWHIWEKKSQNKFNEIFLEGGDSLSTLAFAVSGDAHWMPMDPKAEGGVASITEDKIQVMSSTIPQAHNSSEPASSLQIHQERAITMT